MQVQSIQNNNASFGQKLIFDGKLISRATKQEKLEMAQLKRLFKDNGVNGTINVQSCDTLSVRDVIKNLRSRFNKTEAKLAESRVFEENTCNRRWWQL